jgi:replicative DNA helicase
MSLDVDAVGALISGFETKGVDAVTEAFDNGLRSDLFIGPGQRLFDFVQGYYLSHGVMPAKSILETEFPSVVFTPREDLGELGYYLAQLKDRKLHGIAAEAVRVMSEHLKSRSSMKAVEAAQAFLQEAMESMGTGERVNLATRPQSRLEAYEARKGNPGISGMPTPWPELDVATDGWQPGDYVPIVARTSVGKTWLLLAILERLHREGHRPLLVTMEMQPVNIARRIDAIRAKVGARNIRRGSLSLDEEAMFKASLGTWRNDWWIIGSERQFSVSKLEMLCQTLKPTCVAWDGIYLGHDDLKGRTREERLTNLSRSMKGMLNRLQIPGFVTTQFSRTEAGKEGDLAGIGYSDAFGQDGDIVIGMHQTPDMKDDGFMQLKLLKFREGELSDIKLKWDLDKADMRSEAQQLVESNGFDDLPDGVSVGNGATYNW